MKTLKTMLTDIPQLYELRKKTAQGTNEVGAIQLLTPKTAKRANARLAKKGNLYQWHRPKSNAY
jgi:hypothetical protein